MMNEEDASEFDIPCSFHYSLLPCGIMVVRQILALNVRVRILAGQQDIEQRNKDL